MLAADVRVTDFLNHYHTKVKTNPNLYISGKDSVNVILPNSLLEYANAAAGHSGFGAGARARGIRKPVNNAASAIKDIFKNVESLTQFLQSSECNAEAYVQGIRIKHLGVKKARGLGYPIPTDDRTAESAWSNIYEKHNVKDLVVRYGREAVLQARKQLTVNEFELRFGLAA